MLLTKVTKLKYIYFFYLKYIFSVFQLHFLSLINFARTKCKYHYSLKILLLYKNTNVFTPTSSHHVCAAVMDFTHLTNLYHSQSYFAFVVDKKRFCDQMGATLDKKNF